MDKKFWGILGGLIVIAVVLAIVFSGNTPKTNAKPTNWLEGSSKTGVKLVEYGDYQCPHCGNFYATVKDVTKKYSKLIQFQFIAFPLAEFPNSVAASRAADAAGLQGKYFEMHDKLYDANQAYYVNNESTWLPATDPVPFFEKYAKEIGLNMTKYRKDFNSAKVNDWVNADRQKGNNNGVDGVPTFVLDGQELTLDKLIDSKTGEPSVAAFSKLINAAIKKKTGHEPKASQLVKVDEQPATSSQSSNDGSLESKVK